MGPGQMFAVLAQRHMHLYGTTREHFCEVAISTAQQRDPAADVADAGAADARAVLRAPG